MNGGKIDIDSWFQTYFKIKRIISRIVHVQLATVQFQWYWLGKQYLGIGPSAHSFDGDSRQFNIANNSLYIKGIEVGNLNFELEKLTDTDKTNEYLMTSLRTIWGTDLNKLSKLSNDRFEAQNQKIVDDYFTFLKVPKRVQHVFYRTIENINSRPIDELDVDAAIIFSDILVVPEAMGLNYEMEEKRGPKFPQVIENQRDIARLLAGPEPAARLDYVFNAIRLSKKELAGRVPLIGFAGAPWTIFAFIMANSVSTNRRRRHSV